MSGQFWIIQTLNSLAFGGLLFLLSSGFSLIFGLMRIPNLAHGAFFMFGAYVGYTAVALTGSFWGALIAAPIRPARIDFQNFIAISRMWVTTVLWPADMTSA